MAQPYVQWLVEDRSQTHVRILPEGRRWAAISRFRFTAAVIVGRFRQMASYDDCWCYHDEQSAAEALKAQDGTHEATGWQRHPASGRRFERNEC
jgi:hypothetical protein